MSSGAVCMAGLFRKLEKVGLASCLRSVVMVVGVVFSSVALADDYEVLKQKQCTILVTPATGLSVGQTGEGETSAGKTFTFRVSKKQSRNAILVVSGRNGKCGKIKGTFSTSSSGRGGEKKLSFGLAATGGLFTFKQPFTPNASNNPDGTPAEQQPQTINGLSGLGYSGGAFLKFTPKPPFGLELGVSFLTAGTNGKTVLTNNDDYSVTAKFSEVVLQPALSLQKCISARLFCKVGGVFGIPLKATIGIKTNGLDIETTMKYSRMGGEVAIGLNLGSAFTLLGGSQLSSVKGSFQFGPEADPVNLQNPLTVFIFGGFLVTF